MKSWGWKFLGLDFYFGINVIVDFYRFGVFIFSFVMFSGVFIFSVIVF